MPRRYIALLPLLAAMIGCVACVEETRRDYGPNGLTYPTPRVTYYTPSTFLWLFFGFTYGTNGQPYIWTLVNGVPTPVPLTPTPFFRLLQANGQPTISPTGQTVGSSFGTPGSGDVVRTLYAPDAFSKGVLVLSYPALTQTGVITPGGQPWDVVLSPDQSTLYAAIIPASVGGTGSIAVISTATNTVTRTLSLPTGTYPQFEAISPDGATLYVADNRGYFAGAGPNNLLAIDIVSGALKATITVAPDFDEGALGRPVVSPDGLSIYQADAAGLEAIDATKLQPNYAIPLLLNNQAHSVFTPDGRFLYAPGYHSIFVIDAATSQVGATVNLPGGSASLLGDLAITPDGLAVLAVDLTGGSGQGAMYQIDPGASSIVATIPAPAGAPLMSAAMQVVTMR